MQQRFNMPDCKSAVTPLPVGLKLSKDLGTTLPHDNSYQALVGSILYLSVNTRHRARMRDSQPLYGFSHHFPLGGCQARPSLP